jgi:hypothetical protein
MDTVAFLGSGFNESLGVYQAVSSTSVKISTREIDQILEGYTEEQLSLSIMEPRVDKGHQWLYLHLPDQTLVYDAAASNIVKEPVWFTLDSGLGTKSTYRARNFVYVYNQWLSGDPTSSNHGQMVNTVSTPYSITIGWNFGTTILYNNGQGAVIHELELVSLTGRVPLGDNPVVWTQFSLDGESWSQERPIKAGKHGERLKRLVWLQQGSMRHWRIQRFRGTSDAHIAMARLEARVEPLNV